MPKEVNSEMKTTNSLFGKCLVIQKEYTRDKGIKNFFVRLREFHLEQKLNYKGLMLTR